MATWKEDIIKALENLGGVAHLSKIYKEVERIREGNLNPTWDRTIQRELETNSSDSEAFKKDRKGDDLFYMAEGKGKGVWGLRNFDDGKLFFGELENIKVEQDIAYKDSLFISFADSSRVYNWFKNEETIVLELKHHSDGVRYYKIDTKGFKKVYNDTCL